MSNAQKSIALAFSLAVILIGKNVYGNDLGQFKKISFTVAHAGSSQATNEAYQEGSYDNNDINTGTEDHVKFYGNTDHDKGQEHHSQEKDDVDDAKYAYKYGVKDSTTGDMKDHWEIRDGDRVKGVYAFKDADGTKRVVEYTSDNKKGFEATVHIIGRGH